MSRTIWSDLHKSVEWIKTHTLPISDDGSSVWELKRAIEFNHNGFSELGTWYVGELGLIEAAKYCGFKVFERDGNKYVNLDYSVDLKAARDSDSRKTKSDSGIYVVQWGGDTGPVKLGFGTDLKFRPTGSWLTDYATLIERSAPELMIGADKAHPKLVHTIRNVSILYERHLHRILRRYRIEGSGIREAYRPEVLSFVIKLKGPEGCSSCRVH